MTRRIYPCCCAALLALCTIGPAGAQQLADFSHTAAIKLQSPGALYEVTLTPEVYRAIKRSDLGDVRVFNGAGERVPYALVGATEAHRQWDKSVGTPGEKAGQYFFEVSRGAPIDRIRVEVPQTNTIAPVSLWQRDDRRNRHKWHQVANLVGYRLGLPPNEATNPEIIVYGVGSDWMLQADPRGGGLGGGAPVLHVGWIPHRIVFNARGKDPFMLAFGNRAQKSAALPINTVVPGYGTANAYALTQAALQPVASNPRSGWRLDMNGGEINLKRIALWVSLGLAVAVIAFMAWRLLKQMGSEPPQ